MRVVVIGAGIVGACITYRLAQAGADVATVDAGLPAGGTSSATFAWLNAFSKTPRAYFDLNVASMEEHRHLEAELGGAWTHFDGNLSWNPGAGNPAGRHEAAWRQADVVRLREWGYAVELLTPREAAELEPDLDFGAATSVIHTPREGWVEVTPLIAACLQAAVRGGRARLRAGARAVGFRRSGDSLSAVQVTDRAGGTAWIEADWFVLCAGHLTGEVARRAALELPLDAVPGLLAISAPAPASLRRICHTPEVHLRPDGGGRILIGGERFGGAVDPRPSPAAHAEELFRQAAGVLPMLAEARLEAVRVGIRPMPRDGLPMVGAIPGAANAYAAVSHSGVTLGPLWGRIVAEEITTGRPDPRLAPFRPSRLVATTR